MALTMSVRRVCCHAVRTIPRAQATPLLQTFTRGLVEKHHLPCLRHTPKLPGEQSRHSYHPLLGRSCTSGVDIHVCKRNFFPKWVSSSSSSHTKEKADDGSAMMDSREDLKDGAADERTRVEEFEEEPIIPTTDEKGQPLSNWKRMKIMMKAYGYVIIPVHWVIAPVWFGAFYYTIKLGVDIGPLLKALTVSDHHIEYLQNSKASTALLAYALYKIFTPLRYTVTLAATEVTIRRLRRMGYMRPAPAKEKSYRDSFKETVVEMKDKVKDIRDSKNS